MQTTGLSWANTIKRVQWIAAGSITTTFNDKQNNK